MIRDFALVVAIDSQRGIGIKGGLPWHLPEDLKHFKEVTCQTPGPNAVIMGRKTWESIPEKFRPLKGRINIILTQSKDFQAPFGAIVANSFEMAFEVASALSAAQIFVIGGAQVFDKAISHPQCRAIYLTRIDKAFDCDAFFPVAVDTNFQVESSEPKKLSSEGYTFQFLKLIKK